MSILLKGRNGNELELVFIRESLPDIQDGLGDSAYFTVVVRAATAGASWEETSPCINLFEFQNLAEWLESLANDSSGEIGEIELLEPELRFTANQRTDDGVALRVGFHLPDRPEEFDVDDPSEDADYIDLFLDLTALRAAAATLRADLEEFEAGTPKDDLGGEKDLGILGEPDSDLNFIDRIDDEPPGAGTGEDNAGNR